MTETAPVLVIGGGIAGLTLALCLVERGVPVRVFERTADPQEVGAGLLVAANALKVYRSIGLEETLIAAGAPLRLGSLNLPGGEVLSAVDLSAFALRVGALSIGLHRGVFHGILRRALPSELLVLGEECVRYEQRGGEVLAHFASGRTVAGCALVGADGVHSAVRRQLHGDTWSAPRDAGESCWRGLAPADCLPADHPAQSAFTETWGDSIRVGLIPLGGGVLSWHIYFRPWTEPFPDEAGGPRTPDRQAQIRDRFLDIVRGWHDPIAAVVDAGDYDHLLRTENRDRPPTEQWSEGHVVLLGDALHPITPNIGQGAALAVEGAAVLARALAQEPSPRAAIARYTRERRLRVAAMTHLSHGVGPWASSGSRVLRALRNLGTRATPQWLAERCSAAVYGYDVEPRPTRRA